MSPEGETPIRVVVVARYPSLRAGLRAMLDGAGSIRVAGELTALGDATELDVAAVDVLVVELGDEGDVDVAAELVRGSATVFLAEDPALLRPLLSEEPQPRAYLLRGVGAEELTGAVLAVARGLVVADPAVWRELSRGTAVSSPAREAASPLTEREREVLEFVAAGLPNKAIALRLGVSEHTVKFHVASILGKLGAASRTEAVTLAVRQGLLPL
jgi:DNA-binding NarL/FixJ family response regulator